MVLVANLRREELEILFCEGEDSGMMMDVSLVEDHRSSLGSELKDQKFMKIN